MHPSSTPVPRIKDQRTRRCKPRESLANDQFHGIDELGNTQAPFGAPAFAHHELALTRLGSTTSLPRPRDGPPSIARPLRIVHPSCLQPPRAQALGAPLGQAFHRI